MKEKKEKPSFPKKSLGSSHLVYTRGAKPEGNIKRRLITSAGVGLITAKNISSAAKWSFNYAKQ